MSVLMAKCIQLDTVCQKEAAHRLHSALGSERGHGAAAAKREVQA
jgi:hypothetical protein